MYWKECVASTSKLVVGKEGHMRFHEFVIYSVGITDSGKIDQTD